MKNLRTSTLAFVSIITMAFSAHAGEVNFTNVGRNLDMGNLAAGQFGNISYRRPGAAVHSTSGVLAAKSRLVFNFTFTAPINNFASNIMGANYNYNEPGRRGPVNFRGFTLSNRSTDPLSSLSGDTARGFRNFRASAPLLFATADFVKGSTSAQVVLTNFSSGVGNFINTLTLLFRANPSIASASYSVSSVPLPAALPMFAALMGGMFGVGRLRRKKATA